jgi:hypothetical protein
LLFFLWDQEKYCTECTFLCISLFKHLFEILSVKFLYEFIAFLFVQSSQIIWFCFMISSFFKLRFSWSDEMFPVNSNVRNRNPQS